MICRGITAAVVLSVVWSAPSDAAMFRQIDPGFSYEGQAYGIYWGDANSDGLPDFWLSKHNPHAAIPYALGVALYINQGNGKFADKTSQLIPTELKFADFHGAAWADIDNDGDTDLIQMIGSRPDFEYGTSPRVVLRQDSDGKLRDRAKVFGLGSFYGRGWMPTWIDYDRDGRLDVVNGVDPKPHWSAIFHQTIDGRFENSTAVTGYDVPWAWYSLVSDLNNDGISDLMVVDYQGIEKIYDTTRQPFVDLAPQLLANVTVPTPADDIAIADFDNDLLPDLYMTRRGFDDEVVLSDDKKEISLYYKNGGVRGKHLTFSVGGPVTWNFGKLSARNEINIGADGHHPTSRVFTLSPTDDENAGLAPYGNSVPGIYIGWNASEQVWEYVVVGNINLDTRGGLITATDEITITNPDEVPQDELHASDQLLINTADGFVDRSAASTVGSRYIAGNFVATGDFDNDGDVDVYIDQGGPAANRRNVLLLNDGHGVFTRVWGFGAEGSLLGTGGSIAVADYDLDGFLDLAIVNANTHGPTFPPQNVDAPLEIFHNEGNANHWLEIRLHGTVSNADGVGAKAILTTAAGHQLREATNGTHFAAQDFKTLHFGLGSDDTIQRLEVHWPSGRTSIRANIRGDRIIDITERSS